MRKGTQVILALLVFLFLAPTVSAQENKIEDIHIDVQLHEDGSATIQETRQMETTTDTELYIQLENLQDSELLDFHVEGFVEETDWNIEDSFEEKANKYGIIEEGDDYELAWGISEYGHPEYQVSYTLSNLVRQLEDGEALFWNFDTFLSLPADRMTLEVSAPFDLEDQVLDFYGFGFEGPLEINEGNLQWTGYGLDDGNDVIVLLQFPTGTFQTSAQEEMTLEEQRDMALEGSSYNEAGPMPWWAKILIGIFATLSGGAVVAVTAYGIRGHNIRKEQKHFYPNKWIKKNQGKISPTPPQIEGDIGKYAALISKVSFTGGGFSEYFFAYLLIWSLEEKITIETDEKERMLLGPKTEARLFIENYEDEVQMNKLSFSEYVDLFELGESTLEEVFWSMLLEAAGTDREVDGPDIEQWSEDNAEEVAKLGPLIEKVSKDWLVEKDYMTDYKVKDWGVNFKVEGLTEKGEQLVTHIIQFDNFIKNIKEVSLSEYENWHELIVWAALFGEAEDTVEYLEEFHPQTWDHLLTAYPVYGHYYGYHYFYTSNTKGLSSGGYSGSGGGFSSSGGGAGAGGGGGGGSR